MEQIKENAAFRILSAIGIVLVVAGHANFQVFDLGGLFPYYSFHVTVFLFVAGYFYQEKDEAHMGAYIKKKVVRLLVPYFLWNLFYGCFAALLRSGGFLMGETISLRTVFIEPFLGGHQFSYNFPAWFVPALFCVEIINICMRKLLSLIKRNNEWLIAAGCLIAGILTVWLAAGGHVWGNYKFPGRLLLMLPAFQLGHCYRCKLEKWDTLPNWAYFGIVLTLQSCIVFLNGGLAYSTVWCTGFANSPVIPFVTMFTGIAFWLRIARIAAPLLDRLPLLRTVGRETYSIMMHHILAFMAVKGVFYTLTLWTPWFGDFDKAAFLSDINYVYLINGSDASKWIYLAAGVLLPLGIKKIWRQFLEVLQGI